MIIAVYLCYNQCVMKIGNIVLRNNLILAPMAGVTDVGFRSLCVECGADWAVTEMISVKALEFRNEKTFELLETADNEKIKVVQLFGSEPSVFAKVLHMPELDKFDIIDINMGCPTPKIVNNGAGSRLMTDISLAEEIIKACVANSNSRPVTVKFRSGWDKGSINCIDFAKMCERAGASAITVHARTREDFYSGHSDWELVAKVKEAVNIPVILSGDVVDKQSYTEALEITKADAVMIGRGALGYPQIFSILSGTTCNLSTMDCIRKHISILQNKYSDNLIVHYIRKHILWYLRNYRECKKIKTEIVKIDDLDTMINMLQDFFASNDRLTS